MAASTNRFATLSSDEFQNIRVEQLQRYDKLLPKVVPNVFIRTVNKLRVVFETFALVTVSVTSYFNGGLL